MWPGSGHSRLRLGDKGLAVPVAPTKTTRARQNDVRGFADGGISTIAKPLIPGLDGNNITYFIRNHRRQIEMGLDTADLELITGLEKESNDLITADALDVQIGRRLYESNDYILYGDDRYLHWIKDDQVIDRLNVGSPILQIEGSLLRTRLGLSYLKTRHESPDSEEENILLYQGHTMDTSLDLAKSKAALLNVNGTVKVWDLGTCKNTWATKVTPRGTAKWGRLKWMEDCNGILWANHSCVNVLDIRAPDPIGAMQLLGDYSSADAAAVCDMSVTGNLAMVLTTSRLYWSDIRFMKPVLSWQHHLSPIDDSCNMTLGSFKDQHVIALGSQIRPYNMFFRSSYDSGLLTSTHDPVLVQHWPNVIVQSQLLVDRGDHLDLYMCGRDGGLHKQRIVEEGREPADFPEIPVDERPPVTWGHNQVDFDFAEKRPPSRVLRMDNIYKWIFEMKRPPFTEKSPAKKSLIQYLGAGSKEELIKQCEDMWITPLPKNEHTKHFIKRRKEEIAELVSELMAVEVPNDVAKSVRDDFSDPIRDIYDRWAAPDAAILELDETLLEDYDEPLKKLRQGYTPGVPVYPETPREPIYGSQQMRASEPSSSQGFAMDGISFSQPLPAVRSTSTKSRKLDRVKKDTRKRKQEPTPLSQPSQLSQEVFSSSQPIDSGVSRDTLAAISLSQPAPSSHKKHKKKSKKRKEGFA